MPTGLQLEQWRTGGHHDDQTHGYRAHRRSPGSTRADLIASYVARAGEDLHDLRTRTDNGARNLLAAASRYASTRLTEIEARFHYVHRLHGDASLSA